MTAKYLIWDFDGTLGYRVGKWSDTLLEALRREQPDHPATAAQLKSRGFRWHTPDRYFGESTDAGLWWGELEAVFVATYTGAGVEAAQAARLAQAVRAIYTDPSYWRLFDDTLPALEALTAQGWQHFILSNHVPELGELLRHLRIDGLISRVFNSAETGYEKPHPQAFRKALAATEPGATVWMIGDNPRADIAGAQAVGIPAILVRTAGDGNGYCCADLTGVAAILAEGLQ